MGHLGRREIRLCVSMRQDVAFKRALPSTANRWLVRLCCGLTRQRQLPLGKPGPSRNCMCRANTTHCDSIATAAHMRWCAHATAAHMRRQRTCDEDVSGTGAVQGGTRSGTCAPCSMHHEGVPLSCEQVKQCLHPAPEQAQSSRI